MTIAIGDKVTVNDNYLSRITEDPEELTEAIKTEATVVSEANGLFAVRFDNGIEWDSGHDLWHFDLDELDKL